MIGLERGVLRLVPYCSEWPQLYEQEAARIREAIGEHIRDIQHLSSTAIPGMIAKPIIDIDVAVDWLDEAEVCIKPLEDIGYKYRWKSESRREIRFHQERLEIITDKISQAQTEESTCHTQITPLKKCLRAAKQSMSNKYATKLRPSIKASL